MPPTLEQRKLDEAARAKKHADYMRAYNQSTPERRQKNIERCRKYQKAHRQEQRENERRYRRKVRTEVLEKYGNCCTCCGETTWEFLGIDHVLGGGNQHRHALFGGRAGFAFYSWLRRQPRLPEFQILCHNCNLAKGFYGECPHKKET